MAQLASVSRTELAERRRRLRHQRRLKILQAFWRTLAVMGMTGGVIWGTTLPLWVIRQPDQITIRGNQLLSTEAVQSLLPIDYPQSLLQIQPQAIATQLEAQAPIADAKVSRRLFPPGLTVQIQERDPVAIAPLPANPTSTTTGQTQPNAIQVGLLDANGNWMPLDSYISLNQSFQLPDLKVIGMREQYRSEWPQLYTEVIRNPIKVTEIDWREPSNLVLQTELGTVHFGPYSAQFSMQLKALDQMRQLTQDTNSGQIDYIDLKNPEMPLIQMQDRGIVEPEVQSDDF